MASVRRKGASWELVAYLGYNELGKQIKKYKNISSEGISKVTAKRLAAKFEEEMINAGGLKKEHTIKSAIDYWLYNYGNDLAPTTKERNRQLLSRITPLLGHIRLSKLAPKHILLFIKELQKESLSSRTVNMHFSLLSSILNKCVRWQLLEDNPCLYIDAPKQITKPQPILQENDLSKFILLLLEKAPLQKQLFFMLAFTDGLRRSEICGLKHKDIDLSASTLTISRVAVMVNGKVIIKADTKTKSSHATMYIAPITMDIYQKYKKEQSNITDSQYIFTHADGTLLLPQSFTRWLHAFCKRYNLPRINVQGFRKMAITYAMKKVNLKQASVFGRHTNIDTTAKYYAEVLQSQMQEPTEYLNEFVVDVLNKSTSTINDDKH